MKKYNCFEELRAAFGAETKFTCEGETFKLKSTEKYTNFTELHMAVRLNNIGNDLLIRVYTPKYVYHYLYKSI